MDSKRKILVAALTCVLTISTIGNVRFAAAASALCARDENRTFETSLINLDHPSGEFDGTLQITIGPSGTIVGYFRSVDSSDFIDVAGGISGDKIHLEIGNLPPIEGQYRNGTIVGYVFLDDYTHRFTATSSDRPQT